MRRLALLVSMVSALAMVSTAFAGVIVEDTRTKKEKIRDAKKRDWKEIGKHQYSKKNQEKLLERAKEKGIKVGSPEFRALEHEFDQELSRKGKDGQNARQLKRDELKRIRAEKSE